jgi:hypothetical protein
MLYYKKRHKIIPTHFMSFLSVYFLGGWLNSRLVSARPPPTRHGKGDRAKDRQKEKREKENPLAKVSTLERNGKNSG